MDEMTHKLELQTTYETGAELWLCKECGYEFVASWNPLTRIIINQGGDFEHCFVNNAMVVNNIPSHPEQYNLDLYHSFLTDSGEWV